ncbi:MAG: hypothetical protein ABI411_14230 [Tahibacter sp.]
MRWTEMQDGVEVRWPLIARRLRARPAWTTHYVCVVSGVVVDPAAGEPMPLDGYGRALFGVDLVVECHIATNQLQDYLDAAATRR